MAARWQRPGRNGHHPRLIVIHCTVSSEMGTGAEAVARYFETTDRPGSTHKVSDNNSTVRCVEDEDTAYGAAGANLDGLHIELVGQPDQSRDQWLDAYSRAELIEAGSSIREWSRKFTIPLQWLTVAQVADGETAGLCTHHDVSQAFPAVSTGHWDPGPNFPKDEALRIWASDTPTVEDDMTADELVALFESDPRLDAAIKAKINQALTYGVTLPAGTDRIGGVITGTLEGVRLLHAQQAALRSVVEQLGAGGTVDYAKVQAAAEAGMKDALREGTG